MAEPERGDGECVCPSGGRSLKLKMKDILQFDMTRFPGQWHCHWHSRAAASPEAASESAASVNGKWGLGALDSVAGGTATTW